MVAVADAVGLLAIVAVNAAVAALLTRYLRVQLVTAWGSAIYTALIVPVVQFVVLLVGSGVLNLGPDLGSQALVVGVAVALPMALGVSFDYFWMPAPGELDVPEGRQGNRRRSL